MKKNPTSQKKIRHDLLTQHIGSRGETPPEFIALGWQLGALKKLGEEGFAERVNGDTWRLTRNGLLEALRESVT